MDKVNALNIIRQACGSVQADLATHQQIQTAIQTVEDLLNQQQAKKDLKKDK
jgi:hypothetical protein